MSNPLNNALNIIVKLAKPNKVILFGSQVKAKNNPQKDYDLLVLKKGVKNPRKLIQKIYLNFNNIGAPIDILLIDLNRYEALKNDPYLIYSEVNKNGKIIYEQH